MAIMEVIAPYLIHFPNIALLTLPIAVITRASTQRCFISAALIYLGFSFTAFIL